MSAVFGIMRYLGELEELQTLYNEHFILTSGDSGFWDSYATSPIFPVDEQPESDNFYILFNFSENHPANSWWHVGGILSIYVASNNIKLISDVSDVLRKSIGDYEYSARRIDKWAANAGIDMKPINWTRFMNAGGIDSQGQENGVRGRILTFGYNYNDC